MLIYFLPPVLLAWGNQLRALVHVLDKFGCDINMKTIFYIPIFALLLISGPVTASEPIKCYEKAWENPEKGELGLTAGQAVTLCSGATDANKVIQCYAKAWENPANGGLGLNTDQAIRLCKINSLE